ncbi:hypothetical protein H0H81_000551 [Sphagnurus paluster]|uniref:Protein BTN n=1 Tax=Sphagnurus paluster TaxID=117069 RepID=A0A9P7FN01_9AGAR|nr:hypothetical protein H0H81_000551 [Sphagnurus paluster]
MDTLAATRPRLAVERTSTFDDESEPLRDAGIDKLLYVIILSAALDLVPPSTPKGIIAFCNIAPALIAKVGWPYLLKGRIRYVARLVGCCVLSSFGMLVSAMCFLAVLGTRGLTSLFVGCVGLGELTFLQLSTTYAPAYVAGHSVGYFAAGTGAAGLVGAFLWWEVRSLGVRVGVGLSSVMPLIIPLTYFFLLPNKSAFLDTVSSSTYGGAASPTQESSVLYAPIATQDVEELDDESTINPASTPKGGITLSAADKWRLVWLVYQTTVFLSRSSISLGLPPLPERLLALPAVLQYLILSALALESSVGVFPEDASGAAIVAVFLLVSLEGICGGLAYVNVFYRINQERPDAHSARDPERAKQEKEFKIGSIGFADSSGILFAALLAVPTEMELCKAQVRRGKMLCVGL